MKNSTEQPVITRMPIKAFFKYIGFNQKGTIIGIADKNNESIIGRYMILGCSLDLVLQRSIFVLNMAMHMR